MGRYFRKIVKDYNNSKHRTSETKPNKVNKNTEKELLETVFNYELSEIIVESKFRVGYRVIILYKKDVCKQIKK